MKTFQAQIVVYQEGKYFVAQCLNVNISSFGKTYNEALANIQEAIELYLEDTPVTTTKISHPKFTDLTVTYA